MALPIRNLLILLCALLPKYTDAFSNGKVASVCGTMIPTHSTSAQTTDPPFMLVSSKGTYNQGVKIAVNLSATSTVVIKGFLIQARTINGDNLVGSFEVSNPDAQTLDCNNPADAVSQTGAASKTSIQVTWKAPNIPTGNIMFRATVVRNERTFWANIVSRALNATSNSTATLGSHNSGFRLSPPFSSLNVDIPYHGCLILP
ncbi:hypothetical protein XELAEV_18023412mg [Xenopus laevis]|uniref:Reelin domain-containing protein n=1 Tax=Xenopus laevis TaxID=8355 RepID=A0A974HP28_XENLA|nr:hypothetical protein XELAEV_18023412mg [Xenopus laevis]